MHTDSNAHRFQRTHIHCTHTETFPDTQTAHTYTCTDKLTRRHFHTHSQIGRCTQNPKHTHTSHTHRHIHRHTDTKTLAHTDRQMHT
jgi:hypothetical protein